MNANQTSACKRVMSLLLDDIFAELFIDPVDPESDDAADYYDVIKQPMCLSDVSRKLDKNEYTRPEDFISDVTLVFDNCIQYNGTDSAYAEIAEHMRRKFAKFVASVSWSFDNWFDKVLHIYSQLLEQFDNAPRGIPHSKDAERCLTEDEYNRLAEALGSVTDKDEIFSLSYLMQVSGTKIPKKAKRAKINLRSISPAAAAALWKYAKDTGKLRKKK